MGEKGFGRGPALGRPFGTPSAPGLGKRPIARDRGTPYGGIETQGGGHEYPDGNAGGQSCDRRRPDAVSNRAGPVAQRRPTGLGRGPGRRPPGRSPPSSRL